jgi:hypothetical protein
MFDNYLDKIKERAKQPGPTSERAELVQMFVDKLNLTRGGKYKKLAPAYIASLLAYIKDVSDLRMLYKNCMNAREFGALFWYYVKVKK